MAADQVLHLIKHNVMGKRGFKRYRIKHKLPDLYLKHGSCCFYCKTNTPFRVITLDHFEPIDKIPTSKNPHTKNKLFACKDCNSGLKGNLTIYEFRERVVKELIKILRSQTSQTKIWTWHKTQKFERYKNIVKTTTGILNGTITDFCF